MVQESSQLESFTDTMPPVTTPPESGSRLQIFSMYGRIFSSSVVTVALSQLLFSGSPQNFSGRPNSGDWAAILFHRSQPSPGVSSGAKRAGASWLPKEEWATRLPGVMKTRSFSVSGMVSSRARSAAGAVLPSGSTPSAAFTAAGPSSRTSRISVASFRSSSLASSQLKRTSVTWVLNWKSTPWDSR